MRSTWHMQLSQCRETIVLPVSHCGSPVLWVVWSPHQSSHLFKSHIVSQFCQPSCPESRNVSTQQPSPLWQWLPRFLHFQPLQTLPNLHPLDPPWHIYWLPNGPWLIFLLQWAQLPFTVPTPTWVYPPSPHLPQSWPPHPQVSLPSFQVHISLYM